MRRESTDGGFRARGRAPRIRISSHAPLPFPAVWTLDRGDVTAYLSEIERLKRSYAGRIELYAGMEIDYLDECDNPASDYFRQLPLDYRIGSVHLMHADDGGIVDIDTSPERFAEMLSGRFGGDLRRLTTAYFDKLIRMVEAGGFDFVGHVDKISYNAERCEPGITSRGWYRDKARECFERIAARGLMVEINTKKYNACGVFFPNREHFGLLRELRIPVLVNSDAHRPELIDDGRHEAMAALREAGIREVIERVGNRWVPVEIVL